MARALLANNPSDAFLYLLTITIFVLTVFAACHQLPSRYAQGKTDPQRDGFLARLFGAGDAHGCARSMASNATLRRLPPGTIRALDDEAVDALVTIALDPRCSTSLRVAALAALEHSGDARTGSAIHRLSTGLSAHRGTPAPNGATCSPTAMSASGKRYTMPHGRARTRWKPRRLMIAATAIFFALQARPMPIYCYARPPARRTHRRNSC